MERWFHFSSLTASPNPNDDSILLARGAPAFCRRYCRLVELNVIEQCTNLFKTGAVQRRRLDTYKEGEEYTSPQIHACVFDPKIGDLKRLVVSNKKCILCTRQSQGGTSCWMTELRYIFIHTQLYFVPPLPTDRPSGFHWRSPPHLRPVHARWRVRIDEKPHAPYPGVAAVATDFVEDKPQLGS
jgi:hypothetical protein